MPDTANDTNGHMPIEQWYASVRTDLLALAYRMLGSWADAEDVVQDSFAAVHGKLPSQVSNPKAYLAKAVVHRSLNVLKSAAKRRETYLGLWLPEPWVQTPDHATETVERRDDVSYAFMVMLETLTPLERAVIVLREAFGCDYAEVAGMLDKTEAACRKLASRARKKLGERSASPLPDRPTAERQLVQRWVSAMMRGEIGEILELIAEDAVLVTDGGGKVRAAVNPICGRERVMALLRTLANRRFKDARLHVIRVNGAWGAAAVDSGRVAGIACFDWSPEGMIRNLYVVLNPDKLDRIDERTIVQPDGAPGRPPEFPHFRLP
jgi:RNA polymerase sigma-70 factor (ECF subfamily)